MATQYQDPIDLAIALGQRVATQQNNTNNATPAALHQSAGGTPVQLSEAQRTAKLKELDDLYRHPTANAAKIAVLSKELGIGG